MARRKKKPGMYRWDPTAYCDGMTPQEWEEHGIQMESLKPHRRWARSIVRGRVPSRILGAYIADHVHDVMSVSCLTYDSKNVGHGGQSASLLTWFRLNLMLSVPDFIKDRGFEPCFRCKGLKPAKDDCHVCGSIGWLNNGTHGVESIASYGSDQNPDDASQSTEPETWFDVTTCEVDPQWLEQQPPEVREKLGKFTKLPKERRIIVSEALDVIPPTSTSQNLSPSQRQAKGRDLKKFKAP